MLISAFFAITYVVLIAVAYGWFKAHWDDRYWTMIHTYFPSSVIWPKAKTTHIMTIKAMLAVALLALPFLYFFQMKHL